MINCSICKREISFKDLEISFQIALGNIVNGKFHGEKVLFYHKDCLLSDESIESEVATQIV